ncbi:hypothetical protein [Streptomyces sp. NPDC002644]
MADELSIEETMDFVGLLAASYADKDFDRALLQAAQDIMESE